MTKSSIGRILVQAGLYACALATAWVMESARCWGDEVARPGELLLPGECAALDEMVLEEAAAKWFECMREGWKLSLKPGDKYPRAREPHSFSSGEELGRRFKLTSGLSIAATYNPGRKAEATLRGDTISVVLLVRIKFSHRSIPEGARLQRSPGMRWRLDGAAPDASGPAPAAESERPPEVVKARAAQTDCGATGNHPPADLGYDPDCLVLQGEPERRVRVLRVQPDTLTYVGDGEPVTVPRSRVVHFERTLDLLSDFLRCCERGVEESRADVLRLLARQAESKGRTRLARFAWLHLLLLVPNDRQGHKALGNSPQGNAWNWPGHGLVTAAELTQHELPAQSWLLSSLHYDLHGPLCLRFALGLLRDLEWSYVRFFECFGAELALDDRPERLRVNLEHADHGKRGSLDPDGVITTHFHDAFVPLESLYYAATPQLLHHTMRRAFRCGVIPPLIQIGMAEYGAEMLPRARVGAEPIFDPDRRNAARLARAARVSAYHLPTTAFAMSCADFCADSNSDTASHAVAYAWVHFLLHGEKGKYRAGYMQFLSAVREGHGTASAFRRLVAQDPEEMREEFEAYLRWQPDAPGDMGGRGERVAAK